jgi:hypothetical protein
MVPLVLMRLRLASFAVTRLRRNLHPQEYAHAGRIHMKNWRTLRFFT